MISLIVFPDSDQIHAGNAGNLESSSYGWSIGETLAQGKTAQGHPSRWWRMFWISFCIEGFVVAFVAKSPVFAGIFLIGCVCGGAWQLLVEPPPRIGRSGGHRKITAFLLTILVGAVVFFVRNWSLCCRPEGLPRRTDELLKQGSTGNTHSSYQGVILWPKTPRKALITPPQPHRESVAALRHSKPLVIPFQGSYWYFRYPARRPSRNAHILRGLSTAVDFHSTDLHPLVMEAHQSLNKPIDLACCREIDLVVLNADNSPGNLGVALMLSDSTIPGASSQMLGTRRIRSSEPPIFSFNRPPVEEVLRFTIPAKTTIGYFNELTVVLRPSAERSLGGAKVAVREFRLLPAS